MLFGTPIFLFLFLPLVLGIYYVIPKKYRNFFLLLASLFFYAWGEQKLVVLIIISTLVDFSAGIIIDKGFRKLGLWLSIVFNLSILIYFKYANFAFENVNELLNLFSLGSARIKTVLDVALPIGISFYTFQTMSYTIDTYRGVVKANYNLIDFGCYVVLFPQLIAGPIVKYKEVDFQLKDRSVNVFQFTEGVKRFIIGLSKKILIANQCAFIADGIFILPHKELSLPMAWLGAIAYAIQIVFDFSGYSDMAIGLGKMFGFTFPENFNYPYVSRSLKEFWRRWHISLSTWFRDYLYIPLGGNRGAPLQTYVNILIVFLVTGIWHGANWTFIVWGVIHGVLIVVEELFLKKLLNRSKVIAHFYVVVALLVTWVIFRADNLEQAFAFLKMMITGSFNTNVAYLKFYLTVESTIALLLGIGFCLPLEKIYDTKKINVNYANAIYVVLLLISLFYVCLGGYNPFIYFNF